MSGHHFWLSDAQFTRILLPPSNKVHSVPRSPAVASSPASSTPPEHGPRKTFRDCFVRWSKAGVFSRVFEALSPRAGRRGAAMIAATHLKTRQTGANLPEKGLSRAVSNAPGEDLIEAAHEPWRRWQAPDHMLPAEGQASDHREPGLSCRRYRTPPSPSPTRAMTAIASARPWRSAEANLAFPSG